MFSIEIVLRKIELRCTVTYSQIKAPAAMQRYMSW
jgi:hypothetical protein